MTVRWATAGLVALLLGGVPTALCGVAWALGGVASASEENPPAATRARGTVFVDHDGDGARDPEEPGLSGVAVSNGREVTVSDAEGAWHLPAPEGAILFVTKPAGYAVPTNLDRLPRFYYVHAPRGTPAEIGLRYPGLAPTGPLPDRIDFGLVPRDEPERYDVILFADPQPQSGAELSFLRDDVLESLVDVEAAFGITAGDILFDDLSLFPRYAALVGRIGIPWYHVPGNHEINFAAPDDRWSLETFKRYFGPPYYSFDVGRVHWVVLDTVHYLGRGRGRDDPGVRGLGGYEGRVSEDQLAWLRADLAHVPADRLVALVMHVPLASYLDREGPRVNVVNREALFEVLAGRERVVALAGHTHTAEHLYFGAEDGWRGPGRLHLQTLATASGAWWSGPEDERGVPVSLQRDGTPNGWHVMHVDGNRYTVSFRAASQPRDHQMRVVFDHAFHGLRPELRRQYRHGELLGSPLRREALPATEVLVNLFDGGPGSSVTLRVNDGPERSLERVARPDPFVEELYQRHGDVTKPWVRPTPSSHLWRGRLPDLPAGVHKITVEGTNEYGVRHRKHELLEVVEGGPAGRASGGNGEETPTPR